MFGYLIEVLGIKKSIANTIMSVLEAFLLMSGDVCLIVGLIGMILYMYGSKRFKNAAMLAWIINLIIQIVGGVILHA